MLNAKIAICVWPKWGNSNERVLKKQFSNAWVRQLCMAKYFQGVRQLCMAKHFQAVRQLCTAKHLQGVRQLCTAKHSQVIKVSLRPIFDFFKINLMYYYPQWNCMPALMHLILEDFDKFFVLKQGYRCV